jgi:hypothetical protein
VPAHARNALWLSSAIEGTTQLIRGSPPKPLLTTRWPQGLSRASIRIHSLLPVDHRWSDISHSEKVVQVGGIMTVYGLSVRRLTASQHSSCGYSIIEHVGDDRLQRPSVNYEAICPFRRRVPRKSRGVIVCSVVWSSHSEECSGPGSWTPALWRG